MKATSIWKIWKKTTNNVKKLSENFQKLDADAAVRKKVNMLVRRKIIEIMEFPTSVLQNQLEDIVCNIFSKFKWKIVKNNIEHYYWLKGNQSVTLKFFKKGTTAYW